MLKCIVFVGVIMHLVGTNKTVMDIRAHFQLKTGIVFQKFNKVPVIKIIQQP